MPWVKMLKTLLFLYVYLLWIPASFISANFSDIPDALMIVSLLIWTICVVISSMLTFEYLYKRKWGEIAAVSTLMTILVPTVLNALMIYHGIRLLNLM